MNETMMRGGWDGRQIPNTKFKTPKSKSQNPTEPCNKTTGAVAVIVAILGAISLALLFAGCATGQPTGLERALFTTVTNYVPQTVYFTNVVEHRVDVPQPVMVYQTNTEHQVTVTFQTNLVTQTVSVTNVTPVTVTNAVVTLAGPSGLLRTGETVAGSAANLAMPGTSGIVVAALGGIVALYMGWRNRKLQGHNDVLTQSAGALAQGLATAREVLSQTSQGQAAAQKLQSWLTNHQAATGTITAIAQIAKDHVDNGDAKDAASEIMALIGDNTKATATGSNTGTKVG